MRTEGYSSRSVCVCVCRRLFWRYSLRGGLPTAEELCQRENEKSDFAETTAMKLARSWTELRGPTHQLAVLMRVLYARGAADLDRVSSLCVSSRQKKSQQRASCVLSTTVASPCQTLRELLVGETHTDGPAYQSMVHAQFAEGLHFHSYIIHSPPFPICTHQNSESALTMRIKFKTFVQCK